MRRVLRGVVAALVAGVVAAGCRGDEETAEPAATPEAVAAADGDTAVFAAEPEREALPSNRIYYTLTQHGWYARGEALVHESRAYHAAGMPQPASLPEMRHVGEYQGVDYYVRGDGADSTLYVPVFEGYWQPFRADTARAAN
jgi:hypothetical protein